VLLVVMELFSPINTTQIEHRYESVDNCLVIHI
jgi:hypothetical protein